MITYEYVCNSCNKTFEVERRITDDTPQPCLHCASIETFRLISGGSHFELKGVGWSFDGFTLEGEQPCKKDPW